MTSRNMWANQPNYPPHNKDDKALVFLPSWAGDND